MCIRDRPYTDRLYIIDYRTKPEQTNHLHARAFACVYVYMRAGTNKYYKQLLESGNCVLVRLIAFEAISRDSN